VVKAVLTAVDGKSFLEAKLEQTSALERALDASVPVALMTSFATDATIRRYVEERGLGDSLVFHQFVSLRLEASGELFRDTDGHASLYAPGHGDLFQAVRRSGTIDAFRERGVRVVTISNVDNLGARLDPVVVGAHLVGGRPLTCEVARKEGDMGGAPVRVDGKLQLVEGPRFPPSFDQELAPVFNTNTALIDIDALDEDYDLTWLYVQKTVEGRDAVQLERLYHEVSALVPTQYLEVPRRGPRGRFLPIKTPADLERAEADLRELVAAAPI
jgi:UTP--glucose-1-phosphate uridylyltransferase